MIIQSRPNMNDTFVELNIHTTGFTFAKMIFLASVHGSVVRRYFNSMQIISPSLSLCLS